jgi:RNA polymerase sigma-70 factor, ECF subfamily
MASIAIVETVKTTDTAGDVLPIEDERQLVQRAKRDLAALAILYRSHYAAIYNHILRRVGSQHEADDLVAEVFLAMVRYLPRFRWSGAPFRSWLYRLATNQVNRWARRRRRLAHKQLSQMPIEETDSTDQQGEPVWDLEQAQLALLALAPRYQTVLSLHYLEDMPLTEVAMVLGCRLGTVKSRLSRGREALRALLVRSEDHHAQRK